jgi:hypothetical protein
VAPGCVGAGGANVVLVGEVPVDEGVGVGLTEEEAVVVTVVPLTNATQ